MKFIILALLFPVLASATPAYDASFEPTTAAASSDASDAHEGMWDHEYFKDKVIKELKLSNDQVARLEAVKSKYKSGMSSMWTNVKDSKNQLANILATGASAADVEPYYVKLQESEMKLKSHLKAAVMEAREILTVSQRKQVKMWIEKHVKTETKKMKKHRK